MIKLTPISSIEEVNSVILQNPPWYIKSNKDKAILITSYGWEWVQSRPITDFKDSDKKHRVKKHLKQSIKKKYRENNPKTSLFGGIILSIILNMIINWIVNKLLDSLFD